MATGPITSWQIDRVCHCFHCFSIFLGSKITAAGDCSHESKTLAPWKKSYEKPGQCIKKQRHHFVNKGSYSQSYGFSSGHVQMWELGHKECWALKNWCFQIVVLEKTLESPFDSKDIKAVNPKGNQPWILIGRSDVEAEAPKLWPPDVKSQLTGRKPWCWERLRARGEGDGKGWDGWMASLTQWTGIWANSRKWWRIRKPEMLQSMGSQRVWHDWVTKQGF